ncbi:class I SAM-dependent methyltransferase [Frigoribacterium sp. ACAM 257]|uniref:class I SAM-dependent methyltransferase n=1 Tax=Frigoribacterium sp. ACAM 257 TaxID=2508998 RepID=UPI0011B98153|nr:class I SAM-dependent methyltransferase [Frigoribacterium sp. ACAM 257]TWX37060.1 class I SAM-dependent methyltransferase [Frigoribacterium sp. ACAM 257]
MTTASSPHGFDAANPLSTLASSFGQAADVYERGRPSYPAEAVEWLLPLGARHVVDLGAGTGKLTRVLLPRVEQVTAVEPSEGMRATLERAVPDAASLAGSAESMPLDDSSVDAVFVAQAWHWVDPRAAVPEVARVLRPGGTLALLWNIRDETVPWLAELSQVMHSPAERDMSSDAPAVGEPFAPIERRDFPWVHELGRDELLAMIASRSYVITLSEDDRAQVLRDVGQLLDTHPDTRGAETIRLPYVTRASRTLLPG